MEKLPEDTESAIGAEFERHARSLRRLAVALAVGRDPSRADDLQQDLWIAWAEADRAAIRNPALWLKGALRRLALRRTREDEHRRARETSVARARSEGDHPETGDSAAWLAVSESIHASLRSLEPSLREPIYLRYFESLTTPQIAERLGLPRTTVEGRLKRGLAAMRRRLEGSRRRGYAALALARRPAGSAASLVGIMKLKTLTMTAALLVLLAALLVRGGHRTTSDRALQRRPATVGSAALDLADLPVDPERRGGAEVVRPAEEPAVAAPRTELYCLNVEARGRGDGPLVGAQVWLAPTDGVFNLVGRTDGRGHCQVRWRASTASLRVDVLIQGATSFSSGVQRVLMRSGSVFEIRARFDGPRTTLASIRSGMRALESRLAEIDAGDRARPAASLQTRWRAPSRYVLRAERDPDGLISLLSAASLATRRSDQLAEARDTPDQERVSRDFDAFLAAHRETGSSVAGRIVVQAVDRLGRPAVGCTVLVDRPSWSDDGERELRGYRLDDSGEWTIGVPPGETIVSLGQDSSGSGTALESMAFQIAAGETAHWPVEVDRSGELLLQFASEEEMEWAARPVLVRHASANALWLSRSYPDERGFLAVAGCPAPSVDVAMLGSGGVAPLPIATFPSVAVGETTTLAIDDDALPTMEVRVAPREQNRGVQRARQIAVFGAGQEFGALLDLHPSPDGIYRFVMPAMPARLEIVAERSMRAVVARVEPIPSGRTDVGAPALPELHEVRLEPNEIDGSPPPTSVRVTRIDGPLDLEVARRSVGSSEPHAEWLAAGRYRVDWHRADGTIEAEVLEVRRGGD
ncbi:MAG: RNA polymerase sigma factor [Planctomycetota bacterium]